MRLALVILAVSDLRRSLAFYVAAFGWRLTVDTPVYAEFEVPAGMRLGLYDRAGFARNTGLSPSAPAPGSCTSTELYVYVDDLEAAGAALAAAGAVELSARAPRAWGDEAAYHADPDGNVVVIATQRG